MSDSVWYYARGEQEKGPITTVQIKALAGAGKLKHDDFVWKEGMENWLPAGEVPGLFPDQKPNPADSGAVLPTTPGQSQPAPAPRPELRSGIEQQGRTLGRTVFIAGLFLALLSRGCETLSERNVVRRETLSETTQREFENQWDAKRKELDAEQIRLQANQRRSNQDNQRLQELGVAISKLAPDQAEQLRELEMGAWLKLDIAARKATSDHRLWGYWRSIVFLFATLLVVVSSLAVAYCSDGPERWVSYGILLVIIYSLYASDSVWNHVVS